MASNAQRALDAFKLSAREYNDFYSWAFGRKLGKHSSIEMMHWWNELHGDLYYLSPYSEIYTDLSIMLEMYRYDNP